MDIMQQFITVFSICLGIVRKSQDLLLKVPYRIGYVEAFIPPPPTPTPVQ